MVSGQIPERILIIKMSAFGDVAKAIPTVHAVRLANPTARIAWMVRPVWADLLVGNPDLDLIIRAPRSLRGMLSAALRARAFEPDLVLDMQGLLMSGIISRVSGAGARYTWASGREFSGFLTGNPVVSAPDGMNAVECMFGFARLAGADRVAPWAPEYLRRDPGISLEVSSALARLARPLAGLHIGASEANKKWPQEKWCDLVVRLASAGMGVALLGGTSDIADAEEIARKGGGSVAMLAGKTSPRELAYVASLCSVVVGGDTGAIHVAALVGAPVVCLMGATDPARTGPYGERCRVVHLGLECSPCFRKPTCGGRFMCMAGITPEAVLGTCLSLVAGHA